MPSAAPKPATPRRFRLAPMIWLFTCWALLTVGAAGAVILSQTHQLNAPIVLKGALQAAETPQDLLLPAHIPMGEFLVQQGTELTEGTAILSFGVKALEDRQQYLQSAIMNSSSAQDCLLNKDRLEDYEDAARELEGTVRLDMQTALSACRLQHQTIALDRLELQQQLQQLRHRGQLVQQNLTHALADVSGVERESLRLRLALVALRFSAEEQVLELRIARQITAKDSALVEQAKAVAQDRVTLEQQLARLEAYLADPHLRSPAPGQLQRIRPLPPSSRYDDDIVIAQLRVVQDAYHAQAIIPAARSSGLRVGDTALLRLAGLPLTAPKVPASLTAIDTVPGQMSEQGQSQLTLTLHPDQIDAPLWRDQVIRKLELLNGRSQVEVILPRTTLAEVISRQLPPGLTDLSWPASLTAAFAKQTPLLPLGDVAR